MENANNLAREVSLEEAVQDDHSRLGCRAISGTTVPVLGGASCNSLNRSDIFHLVALEVVVEDQTCPKTAENEDQAHD